MKPPPSSKGKKTVKAWAFLTSKGSFICDSYERDFIFLKKPRIRANPFTGKKTWRPTEVTISIQLPKDDKEKRYGNKT